jgi:hypothetical protein
MGLSYEIVKVLPFVESVEYSTQRKDVFVFGSMKLARIATQVGWNPGSLMDANHDYRVYSSQYREGLLNYDSRILEFGEDFSWESGQYFIRPCEDTKTFNGQVFGKKQWEDFRKYSLTNGHTTTLNEKTAIQVSSVKKIYKEFRFWIVDRKIVTQSQYRLGNMVLLDEQVEDAAHEFCEKMLSKFSVASSFVMDICSTEEGYRIVECGCINCAGFYRSNLPKLIESLEKFYT